MACQGDAGPTRATLRRQWLALCALAAFAPCRAAAGDAAAPDADRLQGLWGGDLVHHGESTGLFVAFAPGKDGALIARISLPVLNLYDVPLGKVTFAGNVVRFASLWFVYDAMLDRLTGTLPADIAPVYVLHTALTRRSVLPQRRRADLDAPLRTPLWIAAIGAPVWSDVAAAHGNVYVGGDDGRLHALAAENGASRWIYPTDGALRAGPTVAGNRIYVTSDDGVLHCIEARDAKVHWQVRVDRARAERLPTNNPKSKFDLHGAAITVAGDAAFAATHEGRVLALDAATGSARWSFAGGERFLSAPFVAGRTVFAGCYDGKVYALDAATGTLRWSFDARAPVTSTPVAVRGVVVIGSRAYDLWGLDAATGRVRWNRYVWFSWIESSAAAAGRTAYVGSSDAARLFAFDALDGQPVWATDVHGYAWGTPALDRGRIFIGTRGEVAAIEHRAHALALDRTSGKVLWRYPFPAPEPKVHHGFAGSAAVAGGRVFLASLDGRLHAFDAS
jgi:outer membrane protein assembly factor BamB